MNTATEISTSIMVLSRGEATVVDRTLLDPQAVKTVRFADEASWTAATALARALASMRQQMPGLPDRTGLIVTSAEGPAATIEAVGFDARAGRASPLRFPAANPGAMTGVSCILFGFRGPVLNLLLPSNRGVPAGWVLASSWLDHGAAVCMALVAAERSAEHSCVARAVLLGRGETGGHASQWDAAKCIVWLGGGSAV
jgi:hypothetical protein